MTDATSGLLDIFRGAGIIFSGTLFKYGFGFLGQILIANALLPARFGTIGLGYTIVSMIGTVILLGVPKGIPRLMSEDDRDERVVVTVGFLLALVLGASATILVALFPTSIANALDSQDVGSVLVPFAIYLIFFPLAQISISSLRGLELAVETIVSRDVLGAVVPIGVFVLFLWFEQAYVGAIVYYIGVQLTTALVATYFLYSRLPVSEFSTSGTVETVRDLFSFSWPLAISTNLILLMNNFDVLMIGVFAESQQIGYYKVVQSLGRFVLLPLSSFVFLFLPVATRYYESGKLTALNELFSSTTKWTSLVTFPVVLVLVLFPESIITLFYKPEYLPGAPALTVFGIGMFLRAFVGPNGAIIKAIDRTKIDLVSAVLGVTVNVVLNGLLIPRYGITGAALATSLGFLTYNVLEIAVVFYATRTHPFSVNTVKPLLCTAAVALVAERVLLPQSLGLVLLAAVGIGIGVVELIAIPVTRSLDESDHLLFARALDEIGVDRRYLPKQIRPVEREK